MCAAGRGTGGWLAAAAETASAIAAGAPEQAPGLIARAARRMPGVEFAAVEVGEPAAVLVAGFDGRAAGQLRGRVLAEQAAPLYRAALAAGGPLAVDDPGRDAGLAASPLLAGRPVGRLFAVPMTVPDWSLAALVVGVRPGTGPAPAQLQPVAAYAAQVSLAWRLAAAQRDRCWLLAGDERYNLAQDLHDIVLQRLFATGLRLQALAATQTAPIAGQLDQAAADLDRTIGDLRRTMAALRRPPSGPANLQARMLAVAAETAGPLGLVPYLGVTGVDGAVPAHLHPQLTAALRHLLLRLARPPQPAAPPALPAPGARVDVLVRADAHEVSVQVADADGGPVAPGPAVDLARWPVEVGGRVEARPGPGGRGTAVTWRLALSPTVAATDGRGA